MRSPERGIWLENFRLRTTNHRLATVATIPIRCLPEENLDAVARLAFGKKLKANR